jgi:hypothetical protein
VALNFPSSGDDQSDAPIPPCGAGTTSLPRAAKQAQIAAFEVRGPSHPLGGNPRPAGFNPDLMPPTYDEATYRQNPN